MPEFRAYIIGDDGHIELRVDIEAEHLVAAEERAKQLVDGHAVELWDGATRLARYEPVNRH